MEFGWSCLATIQGFKCSERKMEKYMHLALADGSGRLDFHKCHLTLKANSMQLRSETEISNLLQQDKDPKRTSFF